MLVVALALTVTSSAPPQKSDSTTNVTGTWNMGLQGDHVIPTALVLTQEDKKVTGTIAMPTQHVGQRVEVQLTGEFASGALELSGSVEHAAEPTTIVIKGTMKEDGTLEGTLSMGQRSIPWTAERLKKRG
jgi:hypothetical protein